MLNRQQKSQQKRTSALASSVDYLLLALQRANIPDNFQHLFNLYGVLRVEDLKEINLEAIEDIEHRVTADLFPEVDFTSRSVQLKYLGCHLGQDSSGQTKPYFVKQLIRKRILEKLPAAVDSVTKEKEEYETFRDTVLKPNTVSGKRKFNSSLNASEPTSPLANDDHDDSSNESSVSTYKQTFKRPRNTYELSFDEGLGSVLSKTSTLNAYETTAESSISSAASSVSTSAGTSAGASVVTSNQELQQTLASPTDAFGNKKLSHQELSELGANLAVKANIKVQEFWRMTNYKGKFLFILFME